MKLGKFDLANVLTSKKRERIPPHSRGKQKRGVTPEEKQQRQQLVVEAINEQGNQTVVANKLGIDRASVSRWAVGTVVVPKKHLDKIRRMAGRDK